jgi:hypothetical protein
MMPRLVAVSVVLIMSGVPLMTVFCGALCPSPVSQNIDAGSCHDHDRSDAGVRLTSRQHDCDHRLPVKAAVLTEFRSKTTAAGLSMPVVAPIDHLFTPHHGTASLLDHRGTPPGSAPPAFSVLRI